MTILIILKRVGILFESAFSLRISLKFYNICLKHFLRINLFTCKIQKPPEGFCKKVVIESFVKFPAKHLQWSLFLIKLQLTKFPVKFAKTLRKPALKNTCQGLLLDTACDGVLQKITLVR